MADIFDVIADGTRREILRLLLDRADVPTYDGTSVSQIVADLGVSQPTVSKHLKVLREAGLVIVREEGQHRYYRLDPTPLNNVDDWIVPFLDAEAPGIPGALPDPAVNAAQFVGRAAASAKYAVESVWRRLPGSK